MFIVHFLVEIIFDMSPAVCDLLFNPTIFQIFLKFSTAVVFIKSGAASWRYLKVGPVTSTLS
jgi:hypothetical protein